MTQNETGAQPGLEVAVFGGGCFWCLDALFRRVAGVDDVCCGYAGGHAANPDYHSVCAGTTGHAEVVRLVFDPRVVGYTDLLAMFFACHDPTTPDRQGADIGTQYRSLILCQSDAQRSQAEAFVALLVREGAWSAPIVTELLGAEPFHPAETYHQNYFEQHPEQGYCSVVIAPKLRKFAIAFADRLAGNT